MTTVAYTDGITFIAASGTTLALKSHRSATRTALPISAIMNMATAGTPQRVVRLPPVRRCAWSA
jgi:hypothetical protein